MGLGYQQFTVFLGFKSLCSRRAFIHRITFTFSFIPSPYLPFFLGTQLSYMNLQHTHLLTLFILTVFFFNTENRTNVYILFSLIISILTQCLPQIWNKFTLIIPPPNLGEICLEPSFVDDSLLQPKIRQQKIQLNRLEVQSINQFIQLKLGASDNSFNHKVSFLAKQLFIIKHGLHHPQVHASNPYFRDSRKNQH